MSLLSGWRRSIRCCGAAPMRGSAYNLPSRSLPIVLTSLEAALILPSPISFTVWARRVSTRGWVDTDGAITGRRGLAASALGARRRMCKGIRGRKVRRIVVRRMQRISNRGG